MLLRRSLQHFARLSRTWLCSPGLSWRDLSQLPHRVRGVEASSLWEEMDHKVGHERDQLAKGNDAATNPLRAYFDGINEGPGVWKWLHYFDVYHRHLSKFMGRHVTVVEVGVYSGGSLRMWREYFGADCRVHGVDIQSECKAYEDSYITIHIGDQADREFWKRFRELVPEVHVLIDDGGHLAEQQMVTLEEMLPTLKPGGVYICEDVQHIRNPFAEFVNSLASGLNAVVPIGESPVLGRQSTPFQADIHSVHLYPFMVVVEKTDGSPDGFRAPKHGTQWQPLL